MSYHLIDIVQKLGHPRVLVLGDLILDRYIWGNAERISQEAPVILLREERQEIRLGGAANVANLLRGLDAEVTMAGVVGNDESGRCVQAELEKAGVNCTPLIVDDTRPTTVKERYLGRAQYRHPHQMLRVDREVRDPLNESVSRRLLDALLPTLAEHQAVLVSDYAKGVCTPDVLAQVIDAARAADIPVIVDPASTANYAHYRRATAVTPNRLETSRATGIEVATQADAFAAGQQLCERLGLSHAFVTLDSDGIALVRADGEAQMLPTRRREVCDITGAGDMVLAMIGVGAAANIDPFDLGRLANIAGGLEVEQVGVVCISRAQILTDLLAGGRSTSEKICTLDELARHVDARRSVGQRVVFTNGCFDLLHPGHVEFLQEAATYGDCLIVAINNDNGVALHKGASRPLISEKYRAMMLGALECVDYVNIFREATPHAVLKRLKPDVLVKGGTTPDIVAREVVEAYGGLVELLSMTPSFSTTALVNKIRAGANRLAG